MTTTDKYLKGKLNKPPYWRLVQLLQKLRLKYQEIDVGERTFHITVPQFGIVFRFNQRLLYPEYVGWDIVDVDMGLFLKNEIAFGQELMWLLIAKGYFAYLRGPETGNSKLFKFFLIDEGWAQKLLKKRLEFYNNEPRHRFMIEQTIRLQKTPVHYILNHYPSYFDYLW